MGRKPIPLKIKFKREAERKRKWYDRNKKKCQEYNRQYYLVRIKPKIEKERKERIENKTCQDIIQ